MGRHSSYRNMLLSLHLSTSQPAQAWKQHHHQLVSTVQLSKHISPLLSQPKSLEATPPAAGLNSPAIETYLSASQSAQAWKHHQQHQLVSTVQLSKHVSPVQLSKHVSPVQLSKHVSPVQLSKHVSPVQLSKHVSPVQLSKHTCPLLNQPEPGSNYDTTTTTTSWSQQSNYRSISLGFSTGLNPEEAPARLENKPCCFQSPNTLGLVLSPSLFWLVIGPL